MPQAWQCILRKNKNRWKSDFDLFFPASIPKPMPMLERKKQIEFSSDQYFFNKIVN